MDVSLPSEADLTSRVRFQDEVIERLRGLPGVHAAGLVNAIPLGGGGANGIFVVTDLEVRQMSELEALFKDPELTGDAEFRVASEGYFRALGIPLRQGRLFAASDGPDSPHVAVVSESFAPRPLVRERRGRPTHPVRRHGRGPADLRHRRVVGDVREAGLDRAPGPVLYASHRQRPRAAARVSFVVDAEGEAGSLAAAARRIVRELDPEVPPRFRTRSSDKARRSCRARRRAALRGA